MYELQRSLINGGFLTEASISGGEGWYGPKTKNAVANFQLQNKIILNVNSPVLGIVGPTTLNRLNSILGAGIYSVTKGGVDTVPAGVQNISSTASTAPLQGTTEFSGIEIWPKTIDYSRFLLYRGVYAEEVLKLQRCLVAGGFLPASALAGGEGWYGPKTSKALGEFQVQKGIISPSSLAYGMVGPITLKILNADLSCKIGEITR